MDKAEKLASSNVEAVRAIPVSLEEDEKLNERFAALTNNINATWRKILESEVMPNESVLDTPTDTDKPR